MSRMISRGDNKEAATERIIHDRIVFSDAGNMADFIIDNDNIQYAVNMILDIINWAAQVAKEK